MCERPADHCGSSLLPTATGLRKTCSRIFRLLGKCCQEESAIVFEAGVDRKGLAVQLWILWVHPKPKKHVSGLGFASVMGKLAKFLRESPSVEPPGRRPLERSEHSAPRRPGLGVSEPFPVQLPGPPPARSFLGGGGLLMAPPG